MLYSQITIFSDNGDGSMFNHLCYNTFLNCERYHISKDMHDQICKIGKSMIPEIDGDCYPDMSGGTRRLYNIIYNLLYNKEDIITFIRPEISLHPLVCSALITVFCNFINDYPYKTLMLYTYCNHFIDSLRIAVGARRIKTTQCIIYYTTNNNIYPITIFSDNNLSNYKLKGVIGSLSFL